MELMTQQGYKQTEVGEIPDDWEVTTIGSVCTIFGRIGFRGYTVNDIVSEDQGAITLSPSNIVDGQLDLSKVTYLSWFKYEESPEIKIYSGDILLVKTGSTFGKTALVKGLNQKATLNPQIVVLKKVKCDNVFLAYEMGFPIIQDQINSAIVGGAIPTLSQKQVSSFKIPLPPTLHEQKAIATALSDVDDLISSLDALIEKKKAIKQGAMQQLLTPPIIGGKRLPGFSGEWVEKTLGKVADFYKGKGLPKSEIKEGGQFPCIHYGELFTKYNEIIDGVESRTNKSQDCFISKYNDVLMPTSDVTPNGLATASALFEDNVILGGDVLVIRPNAQLYGSFLTFLVTTNRPQIMSLVSGTTVYHLYGSDMAKFKLMMPTDINEQKAIAQSLSDMEAEITQLEIKKEKYQAIKQGMMQELLTGKTRLI